MTDRRSLFAGLGTIAVANAIALGGVLYNRSGIDSELSLTEHEFSIDRSSPREESSELKIRLRWCAEPDSAYPTDVALGRYPGFECVGATPGWLGPVKLESLGFDVHDHPRAAGAWRRPRQALVVLELDGPVRQRVMERSREALAARLVDQRRWPDSSSINGNVIARRATLAWLENGAPRLYAIDAGLDREALRARYPDRNRYAIVKALIGVYGRPSWHGDRVAPQDTIIIQGNIDRLEGEQMHVPSAFRDQVQRYVIATYARKATAPAVLNIQIAFGRRLEPWILSVTR